jgi:hypothetical protein
MPDAIELNGNRYVKEEAVAVERLRTQRVAIALAHMELEHDSVECEYCAEGDEEGCFARNNNERIAQALQDIGYTHDAETCPRCIENWNKGGWDRDGHGRLL